VTAFLPLVLEALRVKHEVDIETRSPSGQAKRVPIWIVVVDGVPYVRSVRGERGVWFRRLLESGATIHVGARRIDVSATRVADDAVNAAVSEAIQEKYTRPRSSVLAMIRPEVLPTTARLDPPTSHVK
jgi:hypothetical protein